MLEYIALFLGILYIYIMFGVGFSRAVEDDRVVLSTIAIWPLGLLLVACKGNK